MSLFYEKRIKEFSKEKAKHKTFFLSRKETHFSHMSLFPLSLNNFFPKSLYSLIIIRFEV